MDVAGLEQLDALHDFLVKSAQGSINPFPRTDQEHVSLVSPFHLLVYRKKSYSGITALVGNAGPEVRGTGGASVRE